MRALGVRRWGGPEALELLELPTPAAGPGEVRIRVRAAAVNPVDLLIRRGESAVRMRPGHPVVPGLEVAGKVDFIGPGVTGLSVGDDVMAMINPTRPAGGGYAEWVVLPASWVTRMPAGLDYAEAAALPMSGLTALRAFDLLNLRPGSRLGVTGARGVVGGYLVQMARAAGHEVLTAFGADGVARRAGTAPDGEAVATRALAVSAAVDGATRVVTGAGAHEAVAVGPLDGLEVDGLVDAAVLGAAVLPAVRRGGAFVEVRPALSPALADEAGVRLLFALVHDYDGRADKLDQLRALAAAGVLTPRVAGIYPPDRAAEAHRRQEAGGVGGRLIVSFAG
jgi:NADPH:quinone reductase-like Zn-dependent oxidoreductase